jgi:hypothetical protein
MFTRHHIGTDGAFGGWAVGGTGSGNTLILHWNGATWTRVPGPAAAVSGSLSAVAATSPASAWAVGSTRSGKTLILRWNGTTWK